MARRIVQAFVLVFFYSSLFAQQSDTAAMPPEVSVNNQTNPFSSFLLQIRDSKKVVLQWALQPGEEADYFTIEKNIDGKNYETIGLIKSSHVSRSYEFTDEIPTRGTSLYRVRLTNKNGSTFFSDSAEANIPGSTLISYYPNPIDNVLIVRTAFSAEVLITDGLGKARIARKIGVGPSVIDVSTLESGVYLLRITDKINNVQQVEKLLKN